MRQSSTTVRVRGIAPTTSRTDFEEFAQKLCAELERRGFFSRANPSATSLPLLSLVPQNDWLTGTITFTSTRLKDLALENHKTQWTFDDDFDGITMLYTPEDATPEIDICAVHGLGGNAVDTWTGPTKMWLRDLLPKSAPFDKCRVMTYGYDSALINSKSLQRLQDWADDLLRQVCLVRTSDDEKKRPIIFVCHSMGGLVAREAMVRLNRYPQDFTGVDLHLCGLLFMATPHSGTALADWNEFAVDVLKSLLGLRSDAIVSILKSFNATSVDSQRDFSLIRKANQGKYPATKCLCESSKTRVGLKLVTVVTKMSAGLDDETALQISNVDHRNICKFETVFGGYMTVVDMLKKIKEILTSTQPTLSDPPQNIPGYPRITAPHYPRDPALHYFEGSFLRWEHTFVGRVSEISNLQSLVKSESGQSSKCIGLVGTGGIGKTKILHELALKLRSEFNIFFVRANDHMSLKSSMLGFANSIGHDTLSFRYPNLDTSSIWASYGPSERIREFVNWLRQADNRQSIFILDDLDALEDREKISEAFPPAIPITIFSTRDPRLCRVFSTKSSVLKVTEMDQAEIFAVMKSELEDLEAEEDLNTKELELIADVVKGHPLAASRAISYIVDILKTPYNFPGEAGQKFMDAFKSCNQLEMRKGFLEHKPAIGLSVMETFEISLQRLRQYKEQVEDLLYLIAFSGNYENLSELETAFSNASVLLIGVDDSHPELGMFRRTRQNLVRKEFFAELQSVSIAEQLNRRSPLHVHPLWMECLRQRAGQEVRHQWLHQLFLLYWNPSLKDDIPNLELYRQRWISVADMFGVNFPASLKGDETHRVNFMHSP